MVCFYLFHAVGECECAFSTVDDLGDTFDLIDCLLVFI